MKCPVQNATRTHHTATFLVFYRHSKEQSPHVFRRVAFLELTTSPNERSAFQEYSVYDARFLICVHEVHSISSVERQQGNRQYNQDEVYRLFQIPIDRSFLVAKQSVLEEAVAQAALQSRRHTD